MGDAITSDRQAALQELVSTLRKVARDAKAIRYFNLASWLFCAYDWILNLDREIELIWKQKFTSMTYFYLFNRYISGIFLSISMLTYIQEHNIGDIFCREWWKYEAFTCTICFQVIELTLGLRVYALWNKSKVIGTIIGVFFVLEVLGMLTIVGIYSTHNFTVTDTPFREYGIEDFHLCVPMATTPTGYLYFFWFPALAYGTLIAVLAGWKGVQRYRLLRGGIARSNAQWLFDVLIRDSVVYYIILALLELSELLSWHFGPPVFIQLLVGIGLAAPMVLCSKFILNLRGAYYGPNVDTTRTKLTTGQAAAEEMVTFGGSPHSEVSQPSSRDMKYNGRETTTFYGDEEWAGILI